MTNDKRLDKIDEKIELLLVSNARQEAILQELHHGMSPLKDIPLRVNMLEQCAANVRSVGWKTISSITVALVTGIWSVVIGYLK